MTPSNRQNRPDAGWKFDNSYARLTACHLIHQAPVHPFAVSLPLATTGNDIPEVALFIANDKPLHPYPASCHQTALDAPFAICISSAYRNILSGCLIAGNGKQSNIRNQTN